MAVILLNMPSNGFGGNHSVILCVWMINRLSMDLCALALYIVSTSY